MADFLRVYHYLPSSVRTAVAAARGYYLRSWRYGKDHEELVVKALERENWSPDRWKEWRDDRLSFMLHRAATQVPFYRNAWSIRRRTGDKSSWELLENWPMLSKASVKKAPLSFLSEDCNPRTMFHEHTSGTTGTSLDLWWSRHTVQEWYALFEARCRRWYGVTRHDRWANIGGQLVVPVSRTRPPFWMWNPPLNQLYMSSYHLSPALIPSYIGAMKKYRITYLLGYTSSLYALAVTINKLEVRDLQMKVVITNAEPVYDYQRRMIEEAFQCPVRESYGMAEIVSAATECDQGKLHLWPEVGITEIMDTGGNIVPSGSGELIGTSLINPDMPMIRYQVGDSGTLTFNQLQCSCKRSLPVINSIEGRSDDVLFSSDGRCIGRLDTVFKASLPVMEAQIIQDHYDRVRVKLVPSDGYDMEAEKILINRLRQRMGDVDVRIERVNEIPREPNGKYRAVVSNLGHIDKRSRNLH